MTNYLESKTKRIIRQENGQVDGVLAYRMASDFSHIEFAIARRHPLDKHCMKTASKLALQRLEAGTDTYVITANTIKDRFGGRGNVLKTEQFFAAFGLQYINPTLLFMMASYHYGYFSDFYR